MAWDFRELEGRDLRGQRRSLRRLSGQERALTDSSEVQVAQHLTLRKGAGLDTLPRDAQPACPASPWPHPRSPLSPAAAVLPASGPPAALASSQRDPFPGVTSQLRLSL